MSYQTAITLPSFSNRYYNLGCDLLIKQRSVKNPVMASNHHNRCVMMYRPEGIPEEVVTHVTPARSKYEFPIVHFTVYSNGVPRNMTIEAVIGVHQAYKLAHAIARHCEQYGFIETLRQIDYCFSRRDNRAIIFPIAAASMLKLKHNN